MPISRRKFATALAAVGMSSSSGSRFAGATVKEPELLLLSRNGWMPNNERLPVLLYHHAFDLKGAADPAAVFEQVFERNGWSPQWRNGVYDFHHYHSTAHEVLGFAAGKARLILGGEGGHVITVQAGDVAVLPTGTGHCCLHADPGFLVVGAYPPGQHWDICRSAPSPSDLDRMRHLPFPNSDPVAGASGPLVRHWQQLA